jgi:hypothetical protein
MCVYPNPPLPGPQIPYMIATHGFFFGLGRVPYLMDGLEGDPEVR